MLGAKTEMLGSKTEMFGSKTEMFGSKAEMFRPGQLFPLHQVYKIHYDLKKNQ